MLHVLQLIIAPAFVLRTKSLLPFTAGVAAAATQYAMSAPGDAVRAGLGVLAFAFMINAASYVGLLWFARRPLWQEVVRRAWAPKGAKNARCVFSGEAVTHRCPRCEALVNEMCLMDELRGWRFRMVKEAAPERFLEALKPDVPGMRGRMLLDEAMSCVVDWMQCKSSLCCLGCALELRCCQIAHKLTWHQWRLAIPTGPLGISQVIPSMIPAMGCVAMAAALVPHALLSLVDSPGWRVVPSVAAGIAIHLAISQPILLYHAFSTIVAFTHLHRSVQWTDEHVRAPKALEVMFAGPSYLTELPYVDDTDEDN